MSWFLTVLKKYAVFSGRAQRAEYWYYILFYILIGIGLTFIDYVTGTYDPETGSGLTVSLFALATFLPSLAVAVRRLHDTDRSGWWVLIALIPVIGSLVLLVFLVLDSSPGDNQYGPNPKSAVS
jgi:uncharacterized membrane protein YhaH (DUF805 family)